MGESQTTCNQLVEKLYGFEGTTSPLSGGNDERATPVPIPNTAVKSLSAEDTRLETIRENRSLPELFQKPQLSAGAFDYAQICPLHSKEAKSVPRFAVSEANRYHAKVKTKKSKARR